MDILIKYQSVLNVVVSYPALIIKKIAFCKGIVVFGEFFPSVIVNCHFVILHCDVFTYSVDTVCI